MNDIGVIYEVNLSVDAEIEEQFDTWLRDHVEEMLALPGFISAEVFDIDAADATGGRIGRCCHYLLRDREALDSYFDRDAERMRADGKKRFAGKFSASRRILASDTQKADSSVSCLNCQAPLFGQYCSVCGQKSGRKVVTIAELFRDAIDELFDLDSRIWRTVRRLLSEPGALTRDYLQGRKSRYVPPVRMYLVFSTVLFLVAGTGSSGEATFDNADGAIITALPADSGTGTTAVDTKTSGIVALEDCMEAYPKLPQELRDEYGEGAHRDVCARLAKLDGQEWIDETVNLLPISLLILLPVLALILKVLYLFSKRHYVEHFLFVIHYHSFVFLLLILYIPVSTLLAVELPQWSFPWSGGALPALTGIAVYGGIPVYLYKSMRRVYHQHAALTLVKFFLLLLSYFVLLIAAFVLTLIGAFFVS